MYVRIEVGRWHVCKDMEKLAPLYCWCCICFCCRRWEFWRSNSSCSCLAYKLQFASKIGIMDILKCTLHLYALRVVQIEAKKHIYICFSFFLMPFFVPNVLQGTPVWISPTTKKRKSERRQWRQNLNRKWPKTGAADITLIFFLSFSAFTSLCFTLL